MRSSLIDEQSQKHNASKERQPHRRIVYDKKRSTKVAMFNLWIA